MVRLEKHRYIIFELITNRDDIDEKKLSDTLWNQILRLFGETGTSQTGLWMIYYDKENKRGVIRTSLDYYENVRAALSVITKLYERQDFQAKHKNSELIFHVLGVSGTIKTIKEKFFFVPKKKKQNEKKPRNKNRK